MSTRNRGIVRMQFNDGSEIAAWTRFHFKDHFTDPLGSLDLVAQPPRSQIAEYRERLTKGELVTIFVNDANQGAYLIQTRQLTVGGDGVTISVSCNTPLVTPYQGGVSPKLSFKSEMDAEAYRVVLEALSPYGFDKIIADQEANVAAFTGKPLRGGRRRRKLSVEQLKIQEARPQPGEQAYAYASRIFARLGVALRMAFDGTLLLAAPNYDQPAIYTLVQDFDGRTPGDRFLADPPLTIIDTNDGQFSECIVQGARADKPGTTQTSTPEVSVTAEEANPGRPAYKSIAAAYKPLVLRDKNSRDPERARSTALLALGIRAAKAYVVTGYVEGLLSQTGRVWSVDTMARVVVAAEALDEDMYIIGRELMGDERRGQLTKLELIPKGALQLGEIPS